MNTLYLLYVDDTSIDSSGSVTDLVLGGSRKYPSMCFGTTKSSVLDNIIYDRRSSYVKFKNQKRYYRDYMEIFKFTDLHSSSNPHLAVRIISLKCDISDNQIPSVLKTFVIVYRLCYGSSLILTDPSQKLIILDHIKYVNDPKHFRLAFEPDVPPAERKKQSCQKYAETHRDRLNAKSKRYYERNKLRLKEKRDAAKLLEPTVEPVVA